MVGCMSQIEKRIAKIKNNPKDVAHKEIVAILKYLGCEFRAGKGSHTVYTHVSFDGAEHTMPLQSPLKFAYVQKAINNINIIQNIKGSE